MSPAYWWLEAGSSSDAVIHDNQIRDCLRVPILVQATGGNAKIAPAGAHDRISISGNHMVGCSMPGILVTSTSNLRLQGNRFDSNVESNEVPGLMRQAGLTELKPVVTIQCTMD